MDDYLDNLSSDYDNESQYEPVASLAVKKDASFKNEGHLTIDVFQTEDEIVIQSTIAGADPADIDISVTKDMVTIRGKREPEHKIRQADYLNQELFWGPFSRAVILPIDVDADNAKATFKNGILTISLPKVSLRHGKKLRLS